MQLGSIGVQLLLRFDLCGDLRRRFLLDPRWRFSDGLAQIGDHVLFVGLVAMQLQTELLQSRLLEFFVHDVQSRQLFGDEQDLLAVAETLGEDVGDRLALAGAWRAL